MSRGTQQLVALAIVARVSGKLRKMKMVNDYSEP